MLGKFITIEGGEGVGKTTLTRSLAKNLMNNKINVVFSREPGGCHIADQIRMLFKNNVPDASGNREKILPHTELMLIGAARAQHVQQVIKPALETGKTVLCDRFVDSTRVYQGGIGGIDEETVEQVIAMTTFGCLPHLTILLESDYSVVKNRLDLRSSGDTVDRYDPRTSQEHFAVQSCFKKLKERFSDRIEILNTTHLEVDEAVVRAREILHKRLGI